MANTAPKIKTGYLHCRFDPRLKAVAQRVAAREDISLSNLVVKALTFYIRTKYSKATDAPKV